MKRYYWLPGLLLMLIACIVAVGTRIISYVESHLIDNTGKTLALMAGEIADQLDVTLYERYVDIQVLAETLHPYLNDPRALTQRLIQFHTLYAPYEWLAVTDARGRVVAATDPASVGLDKGSTDWFLSARRAPDVHLMDVSPLDEIIRMSAVGFTAAIHDADGRFLGTVTSRVAVTKIEDIFRHTVDRFKAQHEIPLRVEWQFLSRNGDLITDSILREEWKVNLQWIGLPSALQVSSANKPGYLEERHLRRNLDVITGHALTHGYLEFPGLQWGILVRVEREEILQPVRVLTRTLKFLLIGMVGPVLAMLVWTFTRLRREWAAAIHESQRFSATLIGIADAVIMIDLQGRIAVVNPAAETLTGWSDHAITGQPWQSCIALKGATHEEQHILDQLVSDVFAQGNSKYLPAHATLVRLGGEGRPVEGSAIPIFDMHQQPIGLVLTLRDLSERHKKETALRTSQQQLQAILDHTNAVIFLKDLQGRYLLINRQFETLFHVTQEAIKGKTDYDLFPTAMAKTYQDADAKALASHTPISVDELVPQDDGLHTYISLKFPLYDDTGQPYGVCGIATDITDRKRLEGQLLQVQKMEAIGRLAGGIAHDFNNLLTVITGNNRLLHDDLPSDHPGHEMLAEIAEASDRASQLTAQLLTFSRKRQSQPRRLDLNQTLSTMERLLHRLIGEDVAVDLVQGPPGCLIVADSTQIEQVILNLAINARDAMPQGGRLTIEAGPVDIHDGEHCSHGTLAPGPYVRLRVTDTGMGMTADTLAQCFEPFFTTKAQGKGTGLGLATVYGIVKEHHGVIDVTSRPAQGTCFTLYFLRTQGTAAGANEAPARPAPHRGSETVLLVEDDKAVRTWLKKVLTRADYRIIEAANGHQALQSSRTAGGPVHLLLTDLVMPELSGPEVAAQLTQEVPTLRVLYMSGYSDHPVFKTGGAGHTILQKPFTPEQVLEQIRRVLDAPPS